MTTVIAKVLREPLFHLAMIGAVLFWADSTLNGPSSQSHVIEIDEARINWLKTVSEQETGRPVTDETLPHLIDSFVQEEMLYREALALGLEGEDVIVRRRLVQKMRFIVESVAHSTPPSEEVLRRFYDERHEIFREPVRFSFSHYYFSADNRTDARKDAETTLVEIQGSSDTQSFVGDPFMLPHHFSGQSLAEVSRHFGDDFADGLSDLDAGEWSGPLRSAFGWHLVKITQKRESMVLPYESVAEQVLAKWQEQERLEANEQALAALSEKYEVVIHPVSES